MKPLILTVGLGLMLGMLAATSRAESFYKQSPLFTTAPSETKSMTAIGQLGPIGLGIELHQPAFVMVVASVEPESPAAATGAFKKGQIIEAINGQALKDIDPRIQLGRILEAAEATDGVLTFMLKDDAHAVAREVVVNVPVLGAYSPTWPIHCPKSDNIIRNFADYMSKPGSNNGFAGAGMLMLVATGDDKDLEPVRAWVHDTADRLAQREEAITYPWHIGYAGIAVCEYYLRTGDPKAMAVIQRYVRDATRSEYLDGWSGRGGVTGLGYGYGHLNAGGTAVVTFLLLAKQCGAEIDESLLHRTLTHFFRYAGRGLNPYGDDRPETSFVDNGKNGNLAFAMAAAASLTPEGEDSIYARARDIAAMSSFYTTTYMLHGHTGGGIGEIWRSAAMTLLQDTKPAQYRDFLDNRKWHYDLSRRHDGSFSILGGARYENIEWGACYPWVYAFPRKTLRITGAPPSQFSRTYQLPTRPWGTAADDVFLSLEAAPDSDGVRMDLSGETLAKDSAKPLLERFKAAGELSDDEVRRYVRHPEFLIRHVVAGHAAGFSTDYMFPQPGITVRPHLLDEFARDADPRVRYAGIRNAVRAFDPEADWCQRLFDYAIERLKDDDESWFVKDACLQLVGSATAEMIIPHLDLLASYLGHSEQWLQNAALVALAKAALDERAAARAMPVIGKFISRTQRQSTTGGTLHMLRQRLPEAPAKVQEAAREALGETYANYSVPLVAEGGQNLRGHRLQTLDRFAATLVSVPGGYDVLFELARREFPDKVLPHESVFLLADIEAFGPELRTVILPIIRDQVIYQFIGNNRNKLLTDIAKPSNRNALVTNSMDDLVALYQKIGVSDYDWGNFGPDLRNSEWDYVSFDPPQEQAYDRSPWRYRNVTVPQGMEQWFMPAFDAVAAGWNKGLPPFGQYNGKLDDNGASGRNLWNMKPRTFWEHEVLLVRGSFEFPPLKPGHSYRLRADRGQGVGAGDGFKLFVNGRPIAEATTGLGRREGDNIRGGWITEEFTDDFAKGPVTVAAITFLRYGDRAIVQMPPVPQGIFQLWLEERKLPPLDTQTFRKAAAMIPMLSAQWQASHDPDSEEEAVEDLRFRYDGKFAPNPRVVGKWRTVAVVDAVEQFNPNERHNPGRPPIRDIELGSDGGTDSPNYLWSGDILMDLDRSQALKITPMTLDDGEYLFIEAGGFGPKNPVGWTSQLMVLKRR